MRITFLGHAGFCVETESVVIIMDPWLSPTGAFDGAWFQFPRNHHLASVVQDKLAVPGRQKYVYISHEHKDHFDLPFLETLCARDFKLIIGRFQRPALREILASYGCSELVVCDDSQAVPIPGGYLKVFVDDAGLNRDSAILVKANDCTFLNLNDCKITDRLASIRETEGSVDAFASQFSGATWHPTCYEYTRAIYERIARRKVLSKFEAVVQALQTLQPRMYLPSAGPACFLDPDLMHLNFEPVNIFPRVRALTRYLDRRLPGATTTWPEIGPGDAVDVRSGTVDTRACNRVDESDVPEYLAQYAAEYAPYFEHLRDAGSDAARPSTVLRMLQAELHQKLGAFSLTSRMSVPLHVGLSDFPSQVVEVNFAENSVRLVPPPDEDGYYRVLIPSWQVRRVLEGHITWEDLSLTFRARLKRQPDVYQTALQAFLILEPDDLAFFCAQFAQLEASAERTVVEVDGQQYSVARYCPHQGGDLARGRAEGGYWVCPRHGWRFDLKRGGTCTSNDATIRALALEPD